MTIVHLRGPGGAALPHGGVHLEMGLDRGLVGRVTLVGEPPSLKSEVEAELRDGNRVEATWKLQVAGIDGPLSGAGGTLLLTDRIVSPAAPFTFEVFPSVERASYKDAIESRCELGSAPE